jgi:hypothetical protein
VLHYRSAFGFHLLTNGVWNGSVSECRLLAKNPLKLPGKFQDRDDCPLMTADGWLSEWRVWF